MLWLLLLPLLLLLHGLLRRRRGRRLGAGCDCRLADGAHRLQCYFVLIGSGIVLAAAAGAAVVAALTDDV